MTLIDRIEVASPEQQRELLIEGFNAINPKAGLSLFEAEAREAKAIRFWKLLNVQAYESAALMLLPEGAILHMFTFAQRSATVCLFDDDDDEDEVKTVCRTLSLAILAAVLKAQEKQA